MFGFGETHKWPGIAKLCEEAGEVVQIIGNLMMIRGATNHWSGDLREKLIEEIADVTAAAVFVTNECFTEEERTAIYTRRAAKLTKFYSWHEQGESHENARPE
jgi:NTP pyrophosphatase (non-canonical NTP hydrolase)